MPKVHKDPMSRAVVRNLLLWLNNEKFPHMLKWTFKKNREFSVLFMNKRNRMWDKKYLGMFEGFDNISPIKAAKYKQSLDYEKECKKRGRSNLQKLCNDGVLKQLTIEPIKESIVKYHYRFLGMCHEGVAAKSIPDDNLTIGINHYVRGDGTNSNIMNLNGLKERRNIPFRKTSKGSIVEDIVLNKRGYGTNANVMNLNDNMLEENILLEGTSKESIVNLFEKDCIIDESGDGTNFNVINISDLQLGSNISVGGAFKECVTEKNNSEYNERDGINSNVMNPNDFLLSNDISFYETYQEYVKEDGTNSNIMADNYDKLQATDLKTYEQYGSLDFLSCSSGMAKENKPLLMSTDDPLWSDPSFLTDEVTMAECEE